MGNNGLDNSLSASDEEIICVHDLYQTSKLFHHSMMDYRARRTRRLTAPWLMLTILTLSYSMNFADRTIVNVLGEAIKRDLHLSDTQIGLLGGIAFALLYSVFSVPIAQLSDRNKRVDILCAAMAFWSLMTMLCSFAWGYASLLVMRTAVGIGESGCSPPAQSLITDYFPRARRAFAISIYYLGVPLGSFGGAVFAGTMAQQYGWRTAFLAVGAPGLVLALAGRLIMREPPRGRLDAPDEIERELSLGAVLALLWKTPGLACIAAGSTLGTLTGYAVLQFLPPFLARDFGLGYAKAALFFGILSAGAAALGTPLGGFLTERLVRSNHRWTSLVPACGLLVSVPLYVVAFAQKNLLAFCVVMFAAGIASTVYHGPTFASVHNRIPPKARATMTAILLFLSSAIGLAIGPLAAGLLSDAYAAATFAGHYSSACLHVSGPADGGASQAGCLTASATGVQRALQTIVLVNIAASTLYFRAARSLQKVDADH